MKVLVVEDDRKIATAVRRGLQAEGLTVDVAFDGTDGLWQATEGAYDLIILDINLPGGGGEKVYERLRSMAGTSVLPILVYTGVSHADMTRPIEENRDTFILAKPATPEAIAAAVEKLLSDR